MRLLSYIALGLCCLSASAQRFTVLLDPARGGTEDGAHIDEHTAEKQVTLDVANRLRALLNARDFNVVVTRDADVLVTNDARAATANQAKPVACLLLHATAAGKGLHLFTSALPQAAPGTVAVPWDEAQAPFAERSQRLESELSTAFGRSKLAVSSGRTWVRPLDNMQCPAVAIEIAPDGEGLSAADHGYQNRIAEALAGALLFWRGHTDVMQSMVPAVAPLEVKSVTLTNLVGPTTANAAARPAAGGGTGAGVTPAKMKPSGSGGAPQAHAGLSTGSPGAVAGSAGVAAKPAVPRVVLDGRSAEGVGGPTKAAAPQGTSRGAVLPTETAPRSTTVAPRSTTVAPRGATTAPRSTTVTPRGATVPRGAADPNAIAPVKTPRVKPVPVRPTEGSTPQ